MKKLILLALMSASSVHLFAQKEEVMLGEYFSEVFPIVTKQHDIIAEQLKRMKEKGTWTETEAEKAEMRDAIQKKKEIEARYLEMLKKLDPKKYAKVTELSIPGKTKEDVKMRYDELLKLLQSWRDKKQTSTLPILLGFETGELAGKSDAELERIAEFYTEYKKEQKK